MPSAPGPGDLRIFLRRDAVAAHQDRRHALVAHLAHQKAGFGMLAAVIDEVGPGNLQLGDCRIILLAGIDGFVGTSFTPAAFSAFLVSSTRPLPWAFLSWTKRPSCPACS